MPTLLLALSAENFMATLSIATRAVRCSRGHRVFQQRVSRAAIARVSRERQLAGIHARSFPWERTAPRVSSRTRRNGSRSVRARAWRRCGRLCRGARRQLHGAAARAARAIEPQLKTGRCDHGHRRGVSQQRAAVEEGGAGNRCNRRHRAGSCRRKLDNGNPRAHRPQRPGRRGIAESLDQRRTHRSAPGRQGLPRCRLHAGRRCQPVARRIAPFSIAQVKPGFSSSPPRTSGCCARTDFSVLYVSEQWQQRASPRRIVAHDARACRRFRQAWSGIRTRTCLRAPASMAAKNALRRSLPGAIAALEQIHAWGIENIAATLAVTNATIAAHLQRLGFRIPAEPVRSPHMFGAHSYCPIRTGGNIRCRVA